jgi:phenylalanyl-tRNA synthetase beta chain
VRIVLSWLRELCPTDLGVDELAELLTHKGAEVEAIERPWERLRGVIVARVLEVRDHPEAEKLCLARLHTGSGEQEVVVGVRNMAPGDLVPLAPPGATVPALPEPLGAREIRGVVSNGMLCSPMELGIAPTHDGILVLGDGFEPGQDVKTALGLDDAVLDIEVTPNRPDFLSVVGIAREVSATTGLPLTMPETTLEEDGEKAETVATVEVLDPDRCPRYLARIVRGVRHVAAPLRMQARLTAAGMRPISAAVDSTNYAMLEIGQPLHPFDLALLAGPGIVVRRARDGERLVTLDDVERTFTADDLLICDTERPVAVAGVMGGEIAEMSDDTTDVLLESASFERGGIQRTRRRIELSTEASMRFERGGDPEAVPVGADRACRLMQEWCGARVLAGAVEAGGAPPRRRIAMRASRASLLIGYPVSAGDAVEVFRRLGMPVGADGDDVTVEVPGYRVDVEREVDLIEEVARVQGYERIGSTLPPVRQAGGVPPTYVFLQRIRRSLARSGLREVRLLPFVSDEDLALFGDRDAVRVTNPLQADQAHLRPRLAPGLLQALQRNVARHVRGAALFEVGVVFRRDPDGVREAPRAGFAMTGPATQGWTEPERPFDVFDGTGALEVLLTDLGVRAWVLDDDAPGPPLHPGRSAALSIAGEHLGTVGELHPAVAARLDLGGRVVLGEVDAEVLRRHATAEVQARDVPRFPPVRRDLAFTVDVDAPAGDVRAALAEAAGDLLGECVLFDVHVGAPLPEGRKSLAFSLDLRATDRTLTAEEADAAVAAIAEALRHRFGAELRSGPAAAG